MASLLSELEHVRIPTFTFPGSGACSPYAESAEQETRRWASAHGLIPTEQYLERIARTKYGWLAARCYPHADRELLQLIADDFSLHRHTNNVVCWSHDTQNLALEMRQSGQ